MSWLPPPLIGLAIACAALMPALLVALGWGPPALRRPGPRFKASIVTSYAVWAAAGTMIAAAGHTTPFVDWLAGAAVLFAATLVMQVFWSLLVWGFTLNLLASLSRLNRPADRADWIDAYSGGRSERQICRDRLGVLTALGVAHGADEVYRLDRFRSRMVLSGYLTARWLFGIQP